MLLTNLLLVAFRWYAWFKHKQISGVTEDHEAHKALRRSYLIVLFYIAGIVVSFFFPIVAIVMYLLTPLTLLFPVKVRVENEKLQNDDEDREEAGEEEVKL